MQAHIRLDEKKTICDTVIKENTFLIGESEHKQNVWICPCCFEGFGKNNTQIKEIRKKYILE